ncbi:MAG: HEPN domain-containing protein [Candidatus Aenigmatarchaeota archaeon]
MGNKKIGREKFVENWLKLSRHDIEVAELMFKNYDWPNSVFYSQQSVERAIKALLEANGIIVRGHFLADILKREILPKEMEREMQEKIIEISSWFEKDRKWVITRYPIKKGGKIVLPEEVFTKEIASEALKKARFVLDSISKILKEKGVEI